MSASRSTTAISKPKKKGSVKKHMTSRVVVVLSFSMINSASFGVMLDGT